ncbi:MAG: hypothetical protein KA214_03660 [Neisseriaceae bacterium]|nr:hypothetical protein [Neisseriaceae bacterium]
MTTLTHHRHTQAKTLLGNPHKKMPSAWGKLWGTVTKLKIKSIDQRMAAIDQALAWELKQGVSFARRLALSNQVTAAKKKLQQQKDRLSHALH